MFLNCIIFTFFMSSFCTKVLVNRISYTIGCCTIWCWFIILTKHCVFVLCACQNCLNILLTVIIMAASIRCSVTMTTGARCWWRWPLYWAGINRQKEGKPLYFWETYGRCFQIYPKPGNVKSRFDCISISSICAWLITQLKVQVYWFLYSYAETNF